MNIKFPERKLKLITSKIQRFNILYQIQNPEAIQNLKMVYNEIPDTDCPNCGKCCESVPMSSLEFFNIMSFIQTFPMVEYNRLISLLIYEKSRFFKKSESGQSSCGFICSFWDNNFKICLISPVRPLECRIASIKRFNNLCKKNKMEHEDIIIDDDKIIEWLDRVEDISTVITDKELGVAFKYLPIEVWTRMSRFGVRNTIQYLAMNIRNNKNNEFEPTISDGFTRSDNISLKNIKNKDPNCSLNLQIR